MNNPEKLNKLSEIFKHISFTVGHDLFSKDELEDFNKLAYEEDVIENAYLATIPSHNTEEAIKCSTLIARIIFLSQNNYSKEEIIRYLNINYKYKPFAKFNTTCNETIDNCLYSLYESNSFEDAIKKAINMGGNTNTNGAIVGSMAEALYGVDNELIFEADKKLPDGFVKVLKKGYIK